MLDMNILNSFKIAIGLIPMVFLFFFASAYGQGSIFGEVQNSSGGNPDIGAFSFYGFINNSDGEIRIEKCVGAGYDNNNWYDDFQNYLGEAVGLPYRYSFYDSDINQGNNLESAIPVNSFQREDILMNTVSWPETPQWVMADLNSGSQLTLIWDYVPGQEYHIYRRSGESDGSFFRIDNPGTNYLDGGVADSVYVDADASYGDLYDYVIVPESGSELGPHSAVYNFRAVEFTCGDVNNDIFVNVIDILGLIGYKYKDYPPPENVAAGDADGNGLVNVLDIMAMISYKYKNGPEPLCPLHIDL